MGLTVGRLVLIEKLLHFLVGLEKKFCVFV
jgi:hypothetical protein